MVGGLPFGDDAGVLLPAFGETVRAKEDVSSPAGDGIPQRYDRWAGLLGGTNKSASGTLNSEFQTRFC